MAPERKGLSNGVSSGLPGCHDSSLECCLCHLTIGASASCPGACEVIPLSQVVVRLINAEQKCGEAGSGVKGRKESYNCTNILSPWSSPGDTLCSASPSDEEGTFYVQLFSRPNDGSWAAGKSVLNIPQGGSLGTAWVGD